MATVVISWVYELRSAFPIDAGVLRAGGRQPLRRGSVEKANPILWKPKSP